MNRTILALAILLFLAAPDSFAFDVTNTAVPKQEILSGGVPKDGIPALTDPRTVGASRATGLRDSDLVVGMTTEGLARAYPLSILTWHEIINDRLGKTALAVTYCPLADSIVTFDRKAPSGSVREFGVSGLLYNSNLIMYDRQNNEKAESLWSQVKTTAIGGPRKGEQLLSIPHVVVTWGEWRRKHPETTVVSPQTDHQRDYTRDPYADYFASSELMFPARPQSSALPLKERVIGILHGDKARAYPFSELAKTSGQVKDTVQEQPVALTYDRGTRTAQAVNVPEGATVITSFWFAWYAMHPATEVWRAPESTGKRGH